MYRTEEISKMNVGEERRQMKLCKNLHVAPIGLDYDDLDGVLFGYLQLLKTKSKITRQSSVKE